MRFSAIILLKILSVIDDSLADDAKERTSVSWRVSHWHWPILYMYLLCLYILAFHLFVFCVHNNLMEYFLLFLLSPTITIYIVQVKKEPYWQASSSRAYCHRRWLYCSSLLLLCSRWTPECCSRFFHRQGSSLLVCLVVQWSFWYWHLIKDPFTRC